MMIVSTVNSTPNDMTFESGGNLDQCPFFGHTGQLLCTPHAFYQLGKINDCDGGGPATMIWDNERLHPHHITLEVDIGVVVTLVLFNPVEGGDCITSRRDGLASPNLGEDVRYITEIEPCVVIDTEQEARTIQ